MTTAAYARWPYFIISMVKAEDPNALRKVYKRFVRKNFAELKKADAGKNKMFAGDKFLELKGSALTPQLKKDFVFSFCQDNLFELFFVVVNNELMKKAESQLYQNTARAFNFLIKLSLDYFIRKGLLPDQISSLQLDERNEKTEAKFFLENYLNTELINNGSLRSELSVRYFDSVNNRLIQVADVFANILYSELLTKNYTEQIDFMKKHGYIRYIYDFPHYS